MFKALRTVFQLQYFNPTLQRFNRYVPLQVRELKEEKKLDKLVDRDLRDSFDILEL
jgi:hypothetical protein